MKTQHTFDSIARLLLAIVLVVHFLFFVLEALLWMQPRVHTVLIALLNNPVGTDMFTQALTLKNLFVNQGFYNLFLVLEGLFGFMLLTKKKYAPGFALLLMLCFSAAGAGIVLAISTKAYLLAFFQCVPSLILFFRLLPLFRQTLFEG